MMKKFRIAMAFVGVLIGAGFASGQEMLQYFTAFGIWGIIGSLLSVFIFAFFGYSLIDLGHQFKAVSHRDVLEKIVPPIVGGLIDIFLLLTLFGIGVVMIAGAGSNLNQQFGLPLWLGAAIVSLLVIIVGLLGTKRVIDAIGAMAPFLIALVVIIAATTIWTNPIDWQALNTAARSLETPLPNWFISTLNYASVNLTTAAATSFLIGGQEEDGQVARQGGLLGGIITGLLIVFINFTLFIVSDQVAAYDMPMLQMAALLSPIVGVIMSVLIFLEIWNTAMSVLYSFVTSYVNPSQKQFKLLFITVICVAFILSFGGFKDVIGFVYPAVGYGGFIILSLFVIAWFKMRRRS